MKFYLISNNTDTMMGMRLCGIEGVVVSTREETLTALEKAFADPQIAVVLMTAQLISLCHEEVYLKKQHCSCPLIVEIPDRHQEGNVGDSLSAYIRESVGIQF